MKQNNKELKELTPAPAYLVVLCALMTAATALAYIFWKGNTLAWDVLLVLVPLLIMGAGIRSIAFRKRSRFTARIYMAEMIFPYVWVGICSVLGLLPMLTVIVFLTIATAMGCATTMKKSIGQGTTLLRDLQPRTGRLHLMFATLLALSLLIA